MIWQQRAQDRMEVRGGGELVIKVSMLREEEGVVCSESLQTYSTHKDILVAPNLSTHAKYAGR